MKIENDAFVRSLHSFFYIYLLRQKCCSQNTVDSYKTAFNLFLDYMNEEHQLSLFKMTFTDLSQANLSGFMEWLSAVRKNSPNTCNQRLMAFRSFAKYLGVKDFSLASVYADIRGVPAKKAASKVVDFFCEEGLKTLLLQPDTGRRIGLRNQFFMILMYDTAARCQELLDLRLEDFSLASDAPFVFLTGKGNKTRTVPLMDLTVRHLMNYLEIFHPDHKNHGEDYLFSIVSHGDAHPMSRDTVESFMKKYGKEARKTCPDIPEKVYPHQLRHTRAIHLYRGGMPLAVLSEFLGHATVETTRIYAYADTEMKRSAIEKATAQNTAGEEVPIWNVSDEETLRKLAGLR